MQRSDTYTAQPAATPNTDGSIPSPAGCPPLLNDFQISDIAALTTSGTELFRTFSEASRLTETGQVRAFDASFAHQIGGYPQTALVTDPNDPRRLFISTQENNSADPTTDTSGAWFALTDAVTALEAALKDETSRAEKVEAGLQPKGDYATNSSLNAETSRAEAVEATLQPAGDYATNAGLKSESERAKTAEAGLQPAGDYATNTALNAETNRAQTVEATLQPKGDYATTSSLTAEAERAKSAEASLQPKGDYASNNDLTSEVERAKTVEATLQPRGDYATHKDLSDGISSEEERAKAAEAQAISGTYGLTKGDIHGVAMHTQGDNNNVLYYDGENGWRALALQSNLNAETERAQTAEAQAISGTYGLTKGDIHGVAMHTQGDNNNVLYYDGENGWRALALQSDLNAETERAQTAEAQAISGTYGLTKGDIHGVAMHTQGDNNNVLYYDGKNGWRALALQSDLNAETERAKTAEATYLPLTGGTLEGDVTIKRTHHWNNNRGGGQITLAMDDGPEKFYQQLYRNNGEMTQGILGITDETGDHHWKLQTDGTIVTPSGNNLLETSNTEGRRMRQSFRVSVSNAGRISWPKPYAKDDLVVAHFTPTENGDGQLHIANILNNTQPDRTGCYVAIETIIKNTNDKLVPAFSPVTLDVTVEGYSS